MYTYMYIYIYVFVYVYIYVHIHQSVNKYIQIYFFVADPRITVRHSRGIALACAMHPTHGGAGHLVATGMATA